MTQRHETWRANTVRKYYDCQAKKPARRLIASETRFAQSALKAWFKHSQNCEV